jgi:hypothetical protein
MHYSTVLRGVDPDFNVSVNAMNLLHQTGGVGHVQSSSGAGATSLVSSGSTEFVPFASALAHDLEQSQKPARKSYINSVFL